MNTRTRLFVLAASAISLVGMSSLSASARIVCDEDGDCWHTPRLTPIRRASSSRSIPTAGAGKKASTARGKSMRAAATGTAANGRFSEPKPD